MIDLLFFIEESRATKTKGGLKQAPVTAAPVEVTSAASAAAASDDDDDVDLFDFGIWYDSLLGQFKINSHLDF